MVSSYISITTYILRLAKKPGKDIKHDYKRKAKTNVFIFSNYLTPPFFFTNTSTVFIDMNILYAYYAVLGL